jgi:hypothetical protein
MYINTNACFKMLMLIVVWYNAIWSSSNLNTTLLTQDQIFSYNIVI